MYANAPINDYFAPDLTVEEGRAELRIQVRDDFHHAAGAMHGVVYFKALDDDLFWPTHWTDVFVLTAIEIEFLKPVSSGQIRAVGVVTANNGHRIEATGELYDDQNR